MRKKNFMTTWKNYLLFECRIDFCNKSNARYCFKYAGIQVCVSGKIKRIKHIKFENKLEEGGGNGR